MVAPSGRSLREPSRSPSDRLGETSVGSRIGLSSCYEGATKGRS